jgi:hypothetical protein
LQEKPDERADLRTIRQHCGSFTKARDEMLRRKREARAA